MRLFFRLLEIIDDDLGITIVANHALGERTMILWIELVKPLQNKFGVALVLRKDNGFAQSISACNLDAPLHQILQNDIHRRLVEHKFIQSRRGNKIWQRVIFDEVILIALFVLIR